MLTASDEEKSFTHTAGDLESRDTGAAFWLAESYTYCCAVNTGSELYSIIPALKLLYSFIFIRNVLFIYYWLFL